MSEIQLTGSQIPKQTLKQETTETKQSAPDSTKETIEKKIIIESIDPDVSSPF